jgi:hypothetical protein
MMLSCASLARSAGLTLGLLLAGVAAITSGCSNVSASGSLRAISLGRDPVELPSAFVAAYFSNDSLADTSFMLSNIKPGDLMSGSVSNAQIVHVQLLWNPRPGYTPLDPSATNACIRYIIIADGELGIYGGAGFAMPDGDLDSDTLELSLRDASLQLLEKTPGFVDLLSPAQLTGSFKASRDPQRTRQLNLAASQIVTNLLNRSRYVQQNPDASNPELIASGLPRR